MAGDEPTYGELAAEVAALRAQQAAMADVLESISRSAFDLDAILSALAETASRLLKAPWVIIARAFPPNDLRAVAHFGMTEEQRAYSSASMSSGTMRRVMDTRRPEIVYAREDEAAHASPGTRLIDRYRLWGTSAFLVVPLLRSDEAIGAIALVREGNGTFSDADIAVLQTFADQAVIAIENARLLEELHERNREVSEALDQQTAMADVLSIIASSATDSGPVLQAIAERAAALCGAGNSRLILVEGDVTRTAAMWTTASDGIDPEPIGTISPISEGRSSTEVLRSGQPKQMTISGDEYLVRFPGSRPETIHGWHGRTMTLLHVPLARQGAVIGAISLLRRARPYTNAEISLVQTFADQAVIAIENARLFNELEESNREVREALDEQTAVASVLQSISRSAFDVHAVLDSLVEHAVRLVGAYAGVISRTTSGELVGSAVFGGSALEKEFLLGMRVPLDPESEHIQALVIRNNRPYTITMQAEDSRLALVSEAEREFYRRNGTLSIHMVPLAAANEAIGMLAVIMPGNHRFSEREKRLARTFADQAVIAIENARLFNELQESNREVTEALEQRTAVADVLQAISRTAFDLDAILTQLVQSAARLLHATGASINEIVLPDLMRSVAHFGLTQEQRAYSEGSLREHGSMAQAFERRRPLVTISHADDTGDPLVTARRRQRARLWGTASFMSVPLMNADDPIGAITIVRPGDAGYESTEVDLLQTFADQAVIAIENARLFNEIQQKTSELEETNARLEVASRHKSDFLANMSHELRTPLSAIIGYAELLQEECADVGDDSYLPDLQKIHSAGQHLLTLISGILDLSKIEAGRMTLFLEDFDVSSLVREVEAIVAPLIQGNGNVLTVDCPGDLGLMRADVVKVRQVLFNLLSNAAKFTGDGTVALSVGRRDECISFRITDSGIGMTPEQTSRLFEAFTQVHVETGKRYQGTGLGLNLSREFCRLMGGDITVESRTGHGSTFTVTLPTTVIESGQGP